jgi:hypothetical protein
MGRPLAVIILLSVLVSSWLSHGQDIIQSRGVDPTVQYESLKRFGAWDDRNYNLRRADLDLLAPDEEELVNPIPAFFRVLLRKNWQTLPRKGPAQYPRNALQIFFQKFGGYLINGKIYSKVKLQNGQYIVLMENAATKDDKSQVPDHASPGEELSQDVHP